MCYADAVFRNFKTFSQPKMKIPLAFLLIFFLVSAGLAQEKGNVIPLASARAEKAAAILKQFSVFGADSVPFEILRKAKAVGVFNDANRINLLFSQGIKAKGLMSARSQNGWGVPLFISFGASSVQFKIADQKNYDILFFIMDDKSIESLKKGMLQPKLTLGPIVGGKGTDLALEQASVIYYTFENGKLSGEELGGNRFFNTVVIGLDNNLNKKLYNKKAQTLLKEETNELSALPPVENFRQTLNELLSRTN